MEDDDPQLIECPVCGLDIQPGQGPCGRYKDGVFTPINCVEEPGERVQDEE